ncbi:MAG TPA: Holliday junction branch migration protein RuvA [Candidatus Cybelea sp.]|nr:Holliday junction branch migration protein RuvA [Candidatus Cybelea sp.]
MFARISGSLVERAGETAIVEAAGLGYEIVLPPCIADKLPVRSGERVSLEIYSVMNMDGNSGRFTYYGFTNAIERDFFEALLTVASIGPRSAARAFSLPMSTIAAAIDRGDYALLKTLPGIGQQKARDIVAKLQGKVAKFLLIQDAPAPDPIAIPGFADEALAVLVQLGYRRPEGEAMIRQTLERKPQIDQAETLLAEIYRSKSAKDGS